MLEDNLEHSCRKYDLTWGDCCVQGRNRYQGDRQPRIHLLHQRRSYAVHFLGLPLNLQSKCYYDNAYSFDKNMQAISGEVSIMLRLDHECLVRFFGLILDENRSLMLVMEYGANGSLYDYLQSRNEISWQMRLRLAHELAKGLAYLHGEKIVHRDIKSLNIVLDGDYHAKWCDFGLAVLKLCSTTASKVDSPSDNKSGTLSGTLCWMAPELFLRGSHTEASDIWALGMVFFELASRKIPFHEAGTRDQIVEWIKSEKGEVVPDECNNQVPGFAELMRDCWKEKSTRPTAKAVVDSVHQLCASYAQPLTPPNSPVLDSGYKLFSENNI